MNYEIKKSGNSLILAGVFLLFSNLAIIIPMLDSWYPKDIISAAKLSAFLAVIGFISLIVAGISLAKSQES